MTKQILTLFCILFLSASAALATKYTVSNNNSIVAQFEGPSALANAIAAAASGDTLYVHPSPDGYPALNLSKKLTLIGGGWNRYGTDSYATKIDYINLSAQATGSTIYGWYFIGGNIGSSSIFGNNADSISISNCRIESLSNSELGIDSNGDCDFWTIKNCFFYSDDTNTQYGINLQGTDDQNWVVTNCIFLSSQIAGADHSSLLFTNCAFLPINGISSGFVSSSYITVRNSIWRNNVSGLSNSELHNNLSFNCTSCDFVTGTNTGTGNISGQDPLFANYTLNTFVFTDDLTLLPGSPAIGAGDNGENIGVFAGPSPYVLGTNYAGAPQIPQILSNFYLSNPFVIEGGTLQINGSVVNGE